MTGIEPRPQRWEARVLPLCHRGPANFYLKGVAWRSKESSEYSLGSVVSAQHIVQL